MKIIVSSIIIGLLVSFGLGVLGNKIKTASCILTGLTPEKCLEYTDKINEQNNKRYGLNR